MVQGAVTDIIRSSSSNGKRKSKRVLAKSVGVFLGTCILLSLSAILAGRNRVCNYYNKQEEELSILLLENMISPASAVVVVEKESMNGGILVVEQQPQALIEKAVIEKKATVTRTGKEFEEIIMRDCTLPTCDLVSRSRLFSERCNAISSKTWPLLVTGTPRSGTTYTSAWLTSYGMKIVNDNFSPGKYHGTSSWIFAFEDPHNLGGARTKGGKFRHILHQVRDPLNSITSLCTEPFYKEEYISFVQRHVNLTSPNLDDKKSKPLTALSFWVQWHQFLNDMKFPTYQIELVKAEDLFWMAELEILYNESNVKKEVATNHNKRKHVSLFSWRDLYSLDPELAAKAWDLAHYFNYSYPDVDFDSLTCSEHVVTCKRGELVEPYSKKCPPGTHPFPKNGKKMELSEKPISSGNDRGWVNDGCVEHALEDGTIVGRNGVSKYLTQTMLNRN